MSRQLTGSQLGLLYCQQCHSTVRAGRVAYPRCPRCHAHLHQRKPHSLVLTAVLVACSAVLYIPANLLPVMNTRSLIDDERDTIMSGVLVLLQSSELDHQTVKDTLNVLLKYEADIETTLPQVTTFVARAGRQGVFG